MPDQPTRGLQKARRPTIEVMPHLSAPIDDHPLMPKPPRRWWDKAITIGLVVIVGGGMMAYLFVRATALR